MHDMVMTDPGPGTPATDDHSTPLRPAWQRLSSLAVGVVSILVVGILLFTKKIEVGDALMLMSAFGALTMLPSAIPNKVP